MSERACARCDEELASLTAYWGDPLCSSCAEQLADLFDEQDKWPPVPWEPSEVALLDSSDPP